MVLYSKSSNQKNYIYNSIYYMFLPVNFILAPVYNSIATYSLFKRIVNNKTVIFNMGIPFLISTAAAFTLYYIDTYIGLSNDSLFANYFQLNNHDINKDELYNQFNTVILNFIGFSLISELIRAIESYMSERFTLLLARKAEDTTDMSVYSQQNLIKTSSNYPAISYSYMLISSRSSSYLSEGTSAIIQAGIGAYMLFRLHPILPAIAIIYGGAIQTIGKIISTRIAKLESLATDNVNRQQKPLKQHGVNEAKILVASDAETLNLHHLTQAKLEERTLRDEKMILEKVLSSINKIALVINIGIRWYISGLMLYNGSIKPGERTIIEIGMSKINHSFSFILEIAPQLANTIDHIKKANTFQDILENPGNTQIDKLELRNKKGVLIIKELELSQDGEPFVIIKDLVCKEGERCTVLGAIGSGKSSFLSIIKGLNISSNCLARGNITYPDNTLQKGVMLISQDDYIPFEQPILQFIYSPKVLPEKGSKEMHDLRCEINMLLQEAGIYEKLCDRLELDKNYINKKNMIKKEDSNYTLSGGERKILKLISAIIHKPKVLLLDETFKSLDDISKKKLQDMLNVYLKDTIILSVYHKNTKYEKTDSFYNKEIFLEYNKISLPRR